MKDKALQNTDPNWYHIEEVAPGIHVIEEPGYVQNYLVNGDERSLLIDTGTGLQNIREAVHPLARPQLDVVNTHWHFDHIGGNALFERVGIAAVEAALIERDIENDELVRVLGPGFETRDFALPKGVRLADYRIPGSKAAFTIADGDRFDLGGRVLEAIATPGHTRGSLSFLDDLSRCLLTGDFAYQDTYFLHFEESDVDRFLASLDRVLARRAAFDRLLPAHGPYPLPGSFLYDVRKAFRKIAGGAPPDVVDHSWGTPSHRYHFETFDVLVKPPGTEGVRIFA